MSSSSYDQNLAYGSSNRPLGNKSFLDPSVCEIRIATEANNARIKAWLNHFPDTNPVSAYARKDGFAETEEQREQAKQLIELQNLRMQKHYMEEHTDPNGKRDERKFSTFVDKMARYDPTGGDQLQPRCSTVGTGSETLRERERFFKKGREYNDKIHSHAVERAHSLEISALSSTTGSSVSLDSHGREKRHRSRSRNSSRSRGSSRSRSSS